MPRPKKLTLDFFVHDAHASDDKKIRRLEKKHKCEGYSTYFKLLEQLCQHDGMKLDLSDNGDIELLADDFNLRDAAHLLSILQDCADIGLIDKQLWQSDRVVFSPSLYRRYLDRLEDRKQAAIRKQRQGEAAKLDQRIQEIQGRENNGKHCDNKVITQENKVITQENPERSRDNSPELQNYKTTELQNFESIQNALRENNSITQDNDQTATLQNLKSDPEPIDAEFVESDPVQPEYVENVPGTSKAEIIPFPVKHGNDRTAVLGTVKLIKIGGNFFDERLFSSNPQDVLNAEMPWSLLDEKGDYSSTAIANEVRMTAGQCAYPWRWSDDVTREAFSAYIANKSSKNRSVGDCHGMARSMIRKANYSAPGSKIYGNVLEYWVDFLKNASKSKTPDELTGKRSTPNSKLDEFLRQRREQMAQKHQRGIG